MSVPESVIEDIAYLKSRHEELSRRIDEGNRATQQALAHMTGRMDAITDLMQTLARHSAQHEAHSDGLRRAFAEIGDTQESLDKHVEDEGNWRKRHEKENHLVERRLATWQGIGIGLSLLIAATVGTALWGAGLVVDGLKVSIQQLDERLDRLEQDTRYRQ